MEKCRPMRKLQYTSENWIYSWRSSSSRIHQQYYCLESFARITDIPVSGAVVKNHMADEYNDVPIVVPGLARGSSSSSTSTSPKSSPQDSVKSTSRPASIRSESVSELVQGDPLHDLPERLQEFPENLVDERVPMHRDSPASSSRESASEPLRKVVPGKHSIYTHFPKGLKLWSMPADQNDKGTVQKTHWRSSTSSTKCWWLDNGRSQSCQWMLRISKESPIRSRGTRFGDSMDSIVSVQNKNFSGNWKDLTEVLGADEETKSQLHWQFLGIWQSLRTPILKSLYVNTSPFRDKWDCWKSSTQYWTRDLCSIVAIRSGWKMVGGFYGMLPLSAKYSRSLDWRENTLQKAIRRTLQRTNNSVWLDGWISPCFHERHVKTPPVW